MPLAPPLAAAMAAGEVHGSTPRTLAVLPSCFSELSTCGQEFGSSM